MAGLLEHVPPHSGTFPVPWRGVLVYGVLANVFYTLGPAADISARCEGRRPSSIVRRWRASATTPRSPS